MSRVFILAVASFALCAHAQAEAPSGPLPAPQSVTAEPPKDVVKEAPKVSLEPPPAAKPHPEPPSARDRLLGAFGIGFLGTTTVFKAMPESGFTMGVPTATLRTTVPVIGVRYWTPLRRLGVEAGVGAMVSGSYTDLPLMPGSNVGDGPATTELVVHLSAPVMLASTRHTILFVAPEFRLGFSRFQPDSTGTGVVTALTVDGSLKAGVEIFFSFLGLDNLSIEAGVRAGLTHEARYVVTSLPLEPVQAAVTSQTRFTTSLIANPWDLFTSTLAARYYF
jgi:hypothetical protein